MGEEEESEGVSLSPARLALCLSSVSRTSYMTACANFGSQMNYNSMVIALLMLAKSGERVPTWVSSASTSASFLGSVVGQVVLGALGDRVGRASMMVAALTLMAGGAATSAAAWDAAPQTRTGVYAIVVLARFAAGIGMGAIYPLSAAAAFESRDDGRGAGRAAWALFFQTPGQIFVYVFAALSTTLPISWRTRAKCVLASGAAPALAALPAALSLASRDSPTSDKPFALASLPWTLRSRLVGASVAWFLYDLYAYGVSVYSADIAQWIFGGHLAVSQDAWFNALCSAVAVPSVAASIAILALFDLGTLQVLGFATAAAASSAFAVAWLSRLRPALLALVFVLLRSAIVFGCAVSTFVAPVLLFPPHCRAACSGLAAAAGKLGAFLGTFALLPLADFTSPAFLFFLLAVLAALGVPVTLAFLDATFRSDDDPPKDQPPRAVLGLLRPGPSAASSTRMPLHATDSDESSRLLHNDDRDGSTSFGRDGLDWTRDPDEEAAAARRGGAPSPFV
mmetsp:Transcript_8934/g.28357  ORF Transcript_8934/g.28357 Transcript_8934/m.28357 type:complete len:510 (+) Transcript_8934:38-1567(+)